MKKKELINFFLKCPSLAELEIRQGSFFLRLKKKIRLTHPIDISTDVLSEWVGWFMPEAKKRQNVDKGEVLGKVIMAGVPNEIYSPCKGTIEKIYASKGEPVEYEQPLFKIRPLIP